MPPRHDEPPMFARVFYYDDREFMIDGSICRLCGRIIEPEHMADLITELGYVVHTVCLTT